MKKARFVKAILPLLAAAGVLLGVSLAKKDSGGEAIKALLVTGEGYHDYEAQKKIISEGVSERMDVEWTIWHHKTAEEARKDMGKDGWADPYDIVVYNICHAKETDKAFIEKVVKVHEAGKPAVALHCTMHSYHWQIKAGEGEVKAWNKFLGVSSKGHGPKKAITVTKVEKKKDHPTLKDLPDGWETPEGELYNVQKVITADVLAYGDNGVVKEPQPVIWTNKNGKGKLFATTIGHHNSTMATKEYLDLVANGIRWALAEETAKAAE